MRINFENNRKYWITSDLHFYHNNVILYSNRPFDNIEEMHEHLITSWNNKVQPSDIVLNLGDFAFARENKIIEILQQLNGTQYFLYGNHDAPMKKKKVRDYCKQTKKISLFCDTLEGRYQNHHLFMSHYAHRVWNKSHHGALHFYGHSHGSLTGIGRSVDVGVDSSELKTNYAPMALDDVIDYVMLKPIHKVDHH